MTIQTQVSVQSQVFIPRDYQIFAALSFNKVRSWSARESAQIQGGYLVNPLMHRKPFSNGV